MEFIGGGEIKFPNIFLAFVWRAAADSQRKTKKKKIASKPGFQNQEDGIGGDIERIRW